MCIRSEVLGAIFVVMNLHQAGKMTSPSAMVVWAVANSACTAGSAVLVGDRGEEAGTAMRRTDRAWHAPH
jgi:hypothetical protein